MTPNENSIRLHCCVAWCSNFYPEVNLVVPYLNLVLLNFNIFCNLCTVPVSLT